MDRQPVVHSSLWLYVVRPATQIFFRKQLCNSLDCTCKLFASLHLLAEHRASQAKVCTKVNSSCFSLNLVAPSFQHLTLLASGFAVLTRPDGCRVPIVGAGLLAMASLWCVRLNRYSGLRRLLRSAAPRQHGLFPSATAGDYPAHTRQTGLAARDKH